MNKQEMIKHIAEEKNLLKKDVEKVLDGFFETLEAMKKGEKFGVRNVGVFEKKERAARTGRNPKTGETIQIPAKIYLAFKDKNKQEV